MPSKALIKNTPPALVEVFSMEKEIFAIPMLKHGIMNLLAVSLKHPYKIASQYLFNILFAVTPFNKRFGNFWIVFHAIKAFR